MRREESEQHKDKTNDAEGAAEPGQRHHAGDHRGRRQHDADLERRRGEFIVMVFRERKVAFCFRFFGAFGELLAAFAGRRLRVIARRGLFPGVDLLLH